jgi:phosphodiesterase/alkaline phosphatase D-like protein
MRSAPILFAAGLAALAAVASAQSSPPMQVHIAYSGNPTGTGMTISWMTQGSTASSTVLWGSSPSKLSNSVTGIQKQYLVGYGFHHHVKITGLTPDTMYYYSCGDAAGGFSVPANFTTAQNKPSYPFSVAVFGDAGIPGAEPVIGDLTRIMPQIDFTWHIGDISYAGGWRLGGPRTH